MQFGATPGVAMDPRSTAAYAAAAAAAAAASGGGGGGGGRIETGDRLEGMLDDWLHRARVRAYAGQDEGWPGATQVPMQAPNPLSRGLEQVLAL